MPPQTSLRILVVDDDPLIQELVSTRLQLVGYQTACAGDGWEGLLRLDEQSFHALILDLNMPRLDGLGMLERMKAQGRLRRTPTMVLTASHDAANVRAAIALGASDFLTKPFQDGVLLARVARLTRRAEPGLSPGPEAGIRARSQSYW